MSYSEDLAWLEIMSLIVTLPMIYSLFKHVFICYSLIDFMLHMLHMLTNQEM